MAGVGPRRGRLPALDPGARRRRGLPLPALRRRKRPGFRVRHAALPRAEKDGTLDKLLRNGWAIDDMGDGGLQFDNGLCGVAILELYQATREPRYLQAVEAAADWAVRQPPVPNWNYNAFSVYLLANAARAAGRPRYLESAKLKARLGIYPGQLTDGPRRGRWADPHNARPLSLYPGPRRRRPGRGPRRERSGPPRGHRLPALGLAARNGDFVEKGLTNKDSALEALLLLKTDARLHIAELAGCGVDEALGALERAVRAEFRAGRLPLSPRVWGRFLEYENPWRIHDALRGCSVTDTVSVA